MSQPNSTTDGPSELLLEVVLADMNPEFYGMLAERLIDAGAIEVYQPAALTANQRQATIVRAYVPIAFREQVEEVFMLHSTALSVMALPVDRTRAETAIRAVTTRWGDIRLTLKIWRGRVIEARPVYQDAEDISRSSDAPLRLIYGEASRLGEVFVGQHIESLQSENQTSN